MATFSESEITSLCRIFGVGSIDLSQRLHAYSSIISDSDKTAVLSDIAEYEAIESDNIFVEAGAAGFKGSISPAVKRSLIKSRMAGLLYINDLLTDSSRVVRC